MVKSFLKKRKGFSILELLVVMFIMGLLSTMVLVNYRSNEKRYELISDAQRLTADFRRVQNMAISGTGIYGRYCGYGIVVDQTDSYFLYADRSANCETSNHRYDANDDVVETVNLSSDIHVKRTSPTPLDIFFLPPDPSTFINGSNAPGLSSFVILEVDGTLINERVSVTTAGLIQ